MKKVIHSQSEKEMEYFIQANQRIIACETVLQKSQDYSKEVRVEVRVYVILARGYVHISSKLTAIWKE